jgi:UPF0716 family protein affecting phage T7 exclusion
MALIGFLILIPFPRRQTKSALSCITSSGSA